MPLPSAYLDECVAFSLAEALRKRGFSVATVLEENTTQLEDEAQLTYAAARGYTLVTHNGRHFWQLHTAWRQSDQPHYGIIDLPEAPPDRLLIRTAMMLTWLGTLPDYRSQFFKWGQLQRLLEQDYCPPSYGDDEIRQALGR